MFPPQNHPLQLGGCDRPSRRPSMSTQLVARATVAAALIGSAGALVSSTGAHHGAPGAAMAPAAPPPPLLARRLRGGSEYLSSASLLAQNPEMAKTLVSSKLVSKTRMYGFGVLALGLVLSTMGFMLFFNKTLIGTGNLLTIGGVVLIVGHQRAYAFLAQRERARGSGIFLFGVFLVLRGSARLGVLVRPSLRPPARQHARTHARTHARAQRLPAALTVLGRVGAGGAVWHPQPVRQFYPLAVQPGQEYPGRRPRAHSRPRVRGRDQGRRVHLKVSRARARACTHARLSARAKRVPAQEGAHAAF